MNIKNEAVFAKAVGAKIQKSTALGSKATWSTDDHLKAMADCIAEIGDRDVFECLKDTYNVSAYQQKLAKTFEKSGHFQREQRAKGDTVESLLEKLAAEAAK